MMASMELRDGRDCSVGQFHPNIMTLNEWTNMYSCAQGGGASVGKFQTPQELFCICFNNTGGLRGEITEITSE